jgi:hypothetical protein
VKYRIASDHGIVYCLGVTDISEDEAAIFGRWRFQIQHHNFVATH